MYGAYNIVAMIGLDVEATRKAQDRNYWRQLIVSDPAMDGEHDRVVRVGLMWRQQGRHRTVTTGGNSLHPTQQCMGHIT